MSDEQATTRRDVIAAELDKLEETPVETPVEAPETPTEAPTESPVEKPGRTANRLRDEHGRLLPGKKDAEPQVTKPEKPADPIVAPAVAAPERPQRPSSWKKDYWEHWDKLDPAVAKYIHEREQQYSTGVSTYKQEADRAKEFMNAVNPFLPELQQHGIPPTQWIRSLGEAHRTLALGSPQQKLQMFQRLANDYGVTLPSVQQGQPDQIMQYLSPLQEQVRQLQGQITNYQQNTERQQQAAIEADIQKFRESHEHFDTVRETMSGLLSAGLAQDLQSAYEAALRLPAHAEIFDAMQQQQREAEERKKAEEALATASRARAKVTSVKSATPTGPVGGNSKRDRRQVIAEAVEAHLGGGRV